MTEGFLKRYTELPYLLYTLQTKSLTLMSPATWDDRNDAHFLLAYQKRMNHGAVLALCFTRASETYHHWKVFSGGSGGVCIDFNMQRFRGWADATPGARFQDVSYRRMDEARQTEFKIADLPFVKRHAFRDECESRLIYESQETNLISHDVPFDIQTISRIVLSPWLPKSVSAAVKTAILSIDGCSDLDVFRTTLIDNTEWQRRGDGVE